MAAIASQSDKFWERPSLSRRQPWRSLVGGITVMAFSSCTVVELSESEGATRIERRVGFTSITIQPAGDAVVARVTSLGLVNTPLGFTAGYGMQQFAVLGEDCRAVFWVESKQHIEALEKLTANLEDICLIDANEGDEK